MALSTFIIKQNGILVLIDKVLEGKEHYTKDLNLYADVTSFITDYYNIIYKNKKNYPTILNDYYSTFSEIKVKYVEAMEVVKDKIVSIMNDQEFKNFINYGAISTSETNKLIAESFLHFANLTLTKEASISGNESIYGSTINIVDELETITIHKNIININGTEFNANNITSSTASFISAIDGIRNNIIIGDYKCGFYFLFNVLINNGENYSYRKDRKNNFTDKYGEILNLVNVLYSSGKKIIDDSSDGSDESSDEYDNDLDDYLKRYFYKKTLWLYREKQFSEEASTKTSTSDTTAIYPALVEKWNGEGGSFKNSTTLLSMSKQESGKSFINPKISIKGIYYLHYGTDSGKFLGFAFLKSDFNKIYNISWDKNKETLTNFFSRSFSNFNPVLSYTNKVLNNSTNKIPSANSCKDYIQERFLNYCYAYDGDAISSITDKTGEYRFLNLLDQTEFSGYYIIIVNYDGNEFTSIDIKDSDKELGFMRLEHLNQEFKDCYVSKPITSDWITNNNFESFGSDRSISTIIYHKLNTDNTNLSASVENYNEDIYIKVPIKQIHNETDGVLFPELLNYDISNINSVILYYERMTTEIKLKNVYIYYNVGNGENYVIFKKLLLDDLNIVMSLNYPTTHCCNKGLSVNIEKDYSVSIDDIIKMVIHYSCSLLNNYNISEPDTKIISNSKSNETIIEFILKRSYYDNSYNYLVCKNIDEDIDFNKNISIPISKITTGLNSSLIGEYSISVPEAEIIIKSTNTIVSSTSTIYHLDGTDTDVSSDTNTKSIVVSGTYAEDSSPLTDGKEALTGSITIPSDSATGTVSFFSNSSGIKVGYSGLSYDGTVTNSVSSTFNNNASTDWGLTEEQINANLASEE